MSEKIYLYLLFSCGILCQGIFATFSDEDDRVSSDFLIRNKRVINHLHAGRKARIDEAKYVVRFKENNRANCAGVILSHYTVLTAASCLRYNISKYKILSGSANDQGSNIHHITSKDEYFGKPPRQAIDGIALVTVDPPFEFNLRNTGYAQLDAGTLPAGAQATVFGWGYMYPLQPGPESRLKLQAITLPIMNLEECRTVYLENSHRVHLHNGVAVTDKHICTYCGHQYCARGDAGAPLVINNKVAGIHVWKGEYEGRRNPDVYINLELPDYKEWIRANALLM